MGDDDDDDDGSQNTDDYLMDASYPLEPDVDELLRQEFQMPPNPVPIKLPSMPDIARVTDDKQVVNQSTKAKPDVKTSAKDSHKGPNRRLHRY
ncbi:hypothetical protein RhiirA5_433209 [Rhizophagus irregularis]|uniref:Uncharacterized protein n=1 Tax=Rhizophagus irregularis TaxID=588596 RepID=A0A2N0NS55_9GLOM|nr:hypothetical protein RhiirA5_433209 [Rhizophagus irregularis]